jgi:hypothetical protein
MRETMSLRQPEPVGVIEESGPDGVAERVRGARAGLTTLLREAEEARRRRAEVTAGGDGASAVCAWNHFENIPTFYNWNNRPR